MDVLDAIHGWRTIRNYRPDPVPRAVIEDLLWHAVQVTTPPENETPWALCVIEGAERIDALGKVALDFARRARPPGAPGWDWVDRPGFRVFWDAPAVILICAQNGKAQAPFDCCRAGQNLMLAAHAMGLGTAWLGAPMPWLRAQGVAASLGIPEGFEPSVAMLLGYPAAHPGPKSRPRPQIHWLSP